MNRLSDGGNDNALCRGDSNTMSGPMQISTSANAAVAGSDKGNVHCFAPLRVYCGKT